MELYRILGVSRLWLGLYWNGCRLCLLLRLLGLDGGGWLWSRGRLWLGSLLGLRLGRRRSHLG